MATLRVNESRPAELSQQPEASLAWWRATSTAKRRQRVPMPCDRAPKSHSREPPSLTQAGAAPRRRNGLAHLVLPGSKSRAQGHEGRSGT